MMQDFFWMEQNGQAFSLSVFLSFSLVAFSTFRLFDRSTVRL